MKKIFTYISIVSLTLFAAGCAKEIADPNDTPEYAKEVIEVPGGELAIQLAVPASEDTKTSLGAKDGNTYPVLWSAGDVITLNGTAATEFTPASGNATATAKFKVNHLSAPYNFLYGGVPASSNQVSFPSTQNYVANGFDPAAMPMYASVNNLTSGSVTFNHVGALLKFSFTGDKKIDSVSLTAEDSNMSLSGNFTIGATSGILNGSLTPVSGGAGLIYSFGGHQQLSDTPFVFYIAIPAGTYEGGITLDVVDNASGHMTVKVLDSNASKTIAAGTVREYENVVYIPNKEINLFQIYDAATLETFRTRVANGEKTLNARVTCNATSFSASSLTDWAPIEDYKGIFDGNGKGITGLPKPLFANLQGVVKNLTLNSTINATAADDLNWGIFAKQIIPSLEVDDIPGLQNCTAQGSITYTPASALSDNSQLGGLVGNNLGGAISNCTNQATVTYGNNNQTNAGQASVGGVVGRTQKGGDLKTQGDISNCSNSGAVTFASSTEKVYVGGVVGFQAEKAESMSGCTNSGAVKIASTASSGTTNLGGVVGLGKGTVESCSNEGAVTTEAFALESNQSLFQGGVIGRINTTNTYTGLSNSGAVNVGAAAQSSGCVLNIGGVIGICESGTTVSSMINNGPISVASVTGGAYLQVGGILGNANEANFKLVDCENRSGGTITVASDCTIQSGRVAGIVSRVSGADSDITGCKNYGALSNAAPKLDVISGVIGFHSETGIISGCENHAAVSSTAVPTNDHYLAGIMGKKSSAKLIEFSNCTNEGNITVTCGTHNKSIYMAGIIAGCPGGSSTLTSCSNSGNITNNAEKSTKDEHHSNGEEVTSGSFTPAVSMGGIIARVTDNAIGAITNCTNSGAINNNCAATDIRLGGIIGYVHQQVADIIGCTNSGLVSNNVLADYCYIHVGGILGYTNAKVTMSDRNVNSGKIQGNPTSRVDLCGLTEYDDNIRLAGCIATYNSGTAATLTDQKNEGEIVYAGTVSCGWVYMGGLCGYAQRATFAAAWNTGYVHNDGTVSDKLDMGGIMGRGDHDSQARIQSGSRNEGSVFNNGTVSNEARIGGLCGYVSKSMDITSSTNVGTVKNVGTAANANLGGVCGRADKYVSLSGSSNEGDVIFEGSTSNAVFMAGIIGYQKSNVNSRVRNVENSGAITCNVDVPDDLEIAGIVADAAGYVDNCKNSGPVTIGGNVGKSLYASGICGYNCDNKAMEACENLAGGTITMAGGLSVGNQIFCGGVIGGEPKGKSLTHSGLINRAAITFGSASEESNRINTSNGSFSYIGGCVGGNGDGTNQNTYEDIENYGKITYYGNHKVRLGGCVAYAPTLSGTLINRANIKYLKQPSTGNSHVGGIAGYCQNATLSGAVCVGNVDTYSSKSRALTGGIVGCAPSAMTLISGCKFKGDLRGTTSGGSAGLMCCVESTGRDISFENCVVGTGTRKCHSGSWRTVTNLVLNYGDISGSGDANLCGSGSSDTNGTSAGTITNCTVGAID